MKFGGIGISNRYDVVTVLKCPSKGCLFWFSAKGKLIAHLIEMHKASALDASAAAAEANSLTKILKTAEEQYADLAQMALAAQQQLEAGSQFSPLPAPPPQSFKVPEAPKKKQPAKAKPRPLRKINLGELD